jgi:hypothetical protein
MIARKIQPGQVEQFFEFQHIKEVKKLFMDGTTWIVISNYGINISNIDGKISIRRFSIMNYIFINLQNTKMFLGISPSLSKQEASTITKWSLINCYIEPAIYLGNNKFGALFVD